MIAATTHTSTGHVPVGIAVAIVAAVVGVPIFLAARARSRARRRYEKTTGRPFPRYRPRRSRRPPADARGYADFLRAIGGQSGFGLKLASVLLMSAGLATSKGFAYAGTIVAASLVGALSLGYLCWRRWGGP
jgi:hypothetical protein